MNHLNFRRNLSIQSREIILFFRLSSIHWLHRIRQPTLVMAGSEDPLVPPVNARIISMLIPNNRLFILPGGGHLFMLHSIDKVVPMIRKFLESEAPLAA